MRDEEAGHPLSSPAAIFCRQIGADRPKRLPTLEQAARRLNLVSQLNRLLHNPDAQRIDLGTFLTGMVPDILTLNGAEERVALDLHTESVIVPAASAVPLSLVAAELLSNAIEHGFPAQQGGRIEVALELIAPQTGQLLIRHDGVGLPPGFKLANVTSLGLTIARSFAESLGAELVLVQDRSVVACLTFAVEGEGGAPLISDVARRRAEVLPQPEVDSKGQGASTASRVETSRRVRAGPVPFRP